MQIQLINSLFYLILLNTSYEFQCNNSSISINEIHHPYTEKTEVVRGGKIVTLEFEKRGFITFSCVKNNRLPMMDTVTYPIEERAVLNGKKILKGTHSSSHVWREDIFSKDLSVYYVVRKEYQKEFDKMLDSIGKKTN